MSIREGTLKQPERLTYSKQDFQDGINYHWVYEGNKFHVKASDIMRELWNWDYRDMKYIEGFGAEERDIATVNT